MITRESVSLERDHPTALGGAAAGMTDLVQVTAYGCDPDEVLLFRTLAPVLGAEALAIADAVSADTIAFAAGTHRISVGHKTPITAAHLDALAAIGVRYISTRSVGVNHIDTRHAERVGIRVENVAYSPGSVADYTLMLMLMALRNAAPMIRRVDAGDYRLDAVRGRELGDLTVGVVGTGRIGTAVIDRLRGFGCGILAYDSRPGSAAGYVSLGELLERSDLVTLHAPLTADTHHLLDAARIARLKAGAYVVNTARGPLVDTAALLRALESGRLGGAALDVVEDEDGLFYADHSNRTDDGGLLQRLRALPNVIVSPHTAYFTDRALRDVVEGSLLGCLRFEDGPRG